MVIDDGKSDIHLVRDWKGNVHQCVAEVQPDGTLRSFCSCGWRGNTPFTEGSDILEEWRSHVRKV